MSSLRHHAARAFRSLLSTRQRARESASGTVSIEAPDGNRTLELSDFRLLGLSKCGLPSWRALSAGRPVKIYRCHDEGQAELVERLSEDDGLSRFFPTCHLRRGAYLIVDWIEGDSLRWSEMPPGSDRFSEVTALQVELHQRRPEDPPLSGFTYLGYLEKRWRNWAGVLPIDDVLEGLLEVIGDGAGAGVDLLSHADVTAANLVVERGSRQIKIIDNELLSVSPLPQLDLLNTYRSFGGRLREGYAKGYLEAYRDAGGDPRPLVENRQTLEAAWLMRSIGALLQAGAIDAAVELVEDRRRGIQPRHPLLAKAEDLSHGGSP